MDEFKFSLDLIKEELIKLKGGEWAIFDKPKKNEIAFVYSKGRRRGSGRVYFNRDELRFAYSEKEIAEIVIRKMGGIPPTKAEITMVRLLEDL